MKKIFLSITTAAFLISCSSSKTETVNAINQVAIDLVNVKEDKVQVTVKAPKIKTEEVIYYVPKIIPGTYSEDDYGKFIENFIAYDQKGNKLKTAKYDDNSWTILDATKLDKITYWVNDTYDIEDEHEIFSPAGTNISSDNFMLNMHGFVGYFDGFKETPYQISITKPENLFGATALNDQDPSNKLDVFKLNRYHEVVDNPIMYSQPDTTSFKIDDMDILISVYSPNKIHNAQAIKPAMQKMMQAQKAFLGDFNATKKYAVLLYLSSMQNDANGFGALEHMTSTTVVMPEMMDKDMLEEQLRDVVSHEFFHIVTPLSIHSEEIHNFDYNTPKMSQHLWLYEGVTEYFANLFQINQNLITEDEFYIRIEDKIKQASQYNDRMPFTQLSKNVLQGEYKDNYINVYQKGALIAMCMDIELREASNGKSGILDLMKKLSIEYGTQKPFKDDELFDKIVAITQNNNIKQFIDTHIKGQEPIDYNHYFAKMGVGIGTKQVTAHPFIKQQQYPLISIDSEEGFIFVLEDVELTDFFKSLNLKHKDIIKKINGTAYNLTNVYDLLNVAAGWKENDPITIEILRDNKTLELKGKVKVSIEDLMGYKVIDNSKENLKNAWLKG